MLKRSNVLFTTATLLLLLTSCGEKKKPENKAAAGPPPPARVDVFIASAAAVAQTIEVPGSLAPYEETSLQPEISGRVTGIYFKEGSSVSKGALLVKLYDADLQAQLKKLQVQLEIAKQTEQRQAELLKINGISQQDYDLSLLNVKNLQADIDILKTSIAKTELRAPFSGKIGLRNISEGAYISPQTIVATLRQVSQLKLDFTVPERYSAKMTAGSTVLFKTDGSDKLYKATIIATENNIQENNRSLRVKAVATQQSSDLFAGAFIKVQARLGENDKALLVPTQAVIPQARNKKVIMIKNGLAANEIVTTGVRDSTYVEITSGLKAGDTVLISGLLTTKPGSKVVVNTVQQKN
jgi:membrane fusion protein, multidrug efflux system